MNYKRKDKRANNEVRQLEILTEYTSYAEGSVLVSAGNTKIICTASIEKTVPDWRLGNDKKAIHGWLSSEYRMLPRATDVRRKRANNNVDGRTQEIQRFIGRSLRSVVDFSSFLDHTIWIDCDVIQADGGTRTASINGGFVSLIIALRKAYQSGEINEFPVKNFLAAVSVGIVNDIPLLDLVYEEDKIADVDMNVVMLDSGEIVELQGAAEVKTYSREQLNKMIDLAELGIRTNISKQKNILGSVLSG
tara:strand:+ start:1321 stop:2064 length:744 start_codon:yes stop_codon:yes gene_type:complete